MIKFIHASIVTQKSAVVYSTVYECSAEYEKDVIKDAQDRLFALKISNLIDTRATLSIKFNRI